eukprot:gb/GFBE01009843.1/.p1 GENE.gb/GFBE01009843.1/~~gb/GFBE01009843.1/.p1  ORF type:complete len:103 (+),score=35.78 gb/GFBE01009843.1/:1-309(+)
MMAAAPQRVVAVLFCFFLGSASAINWNLGGGSSKSCEEICETEALNTEEPECVRLRAHQDTMAVLEMSEKEFVKAEEKKKKCAAVHKYVAEECARQHCRNEL